MDAVVDPITQFAPHGYCFYWSPTILWGMIIADLLIAAAYYSIPIALIYIAYKRKESQHNHLLWKFGLFILLCGTTHVVYLWNIWHANYYLEMIVKVCTGLISFYVAVNLWLLIPKILKIPTAQQLSKLNKNLVDSEARYRGLFETANEGIFVVDATGKFMLANRAMADMLGLDHETLLTSKLQNVTNKDGQEFLDAQFDAATGGQKLRPELCFLDANNNVIYTQVACSTFLSVKADQPTLLVMVTNITEKVSLMNNLERLNQELEAIVADRTQQLRMVNEKLYKEIADRENTLRKERESRNRLNAVYNLSPNGIIITNKLGIITDINAAAEAMFGYKRSELIAQHVNRLTPAEFAEEHQHYIRNADISLTSKKLGFGRKLTAIRRYDVQFPVDVSLTKIAHSDEHYYMAVIRDLTELDAAENELRSVNNRLISSINLLKNQTREATLLNEYTEMIQTSDSFDEYPKIINSYCSSILGSKSAKIFQLTRDNKLVSMDADDPDTFFLQDCWALKSNKPYPINERQQYIPCNHNSSKQNMLCVPLSAKGSLLGLIVIEFDQLSVDDEDGSWSVNKTITEFSQRTSICFASLQLLKEKELQSFKDELTGLYNRRFMNESLVNYLPRSTRESKPLTVLMIDVDHFKHFNDNFGHNLGDTVLVQVAHCIEQCMRETDLVCRFGGEEFLTVMYDATEQDGLIKAGNIHEAVQTITNLPLPITVSIGVAEKVSGDDVESLVRHADIALYEAKDNGRNQTQCYTAMSVKPFTPDDFDSRPRA